MPTPTHPLSQTSGKAHSPKGARPSSGRAHAKKRAARTKRRTSGAQAEHHKPPLAQSQPPSPPPAHLALHSPHGPRNRRSRRAPPPQPPPRPPSARPLSDGPCAAALQAGSLRAWGHRAAKGLLHAKAEAAANMPWNEDRTGAGQGSGQHLWQGASTGTPGCAFSCTSSYTCGRTRCDVGLRCIHCSCPPTHLCCTSAP